nr:DNA-directed DNA polymerase [Tanacetum cinerariifolium]
MLFPFSIDGPAWIWLDKEPSRSIFTWDDLISKFVNHFFPPSKTTNVRNEISNFHQKFEETFSEAWDRFKDLLRACPHHRFTELHQLDTFYNGLNPSDQDSLNSAAGGNLLERSAHDVLKIIENKSKVCNSRNKPIVSQVKASNVDSSEIANDVASAVTGAMTAMFKQHQVTPAPPFVKAVEESCVTCGGAHSNRHCPATDGNTFSCYQDNIQEYVLAAAVNYNQGNTRFCPHVETNYRANQISPPGFPPVQNNQNCYNQNQNQNQSYNQNRGNNYQASIQHPQVEPQNEFSTYKKITETSIRAIDMSNQTNELRNMLASYFQKNTASTSGSGSLPSNTIANPRGNLKVITTRSGVSYDGPPIPPPFSSLPKVVERVPENLPEKLGDPSKFLISCDFPELDECLALSDLGASINLMPLSIWKRLSLPELTPMRMILELADRSTTRPAGIAEDVFVKVEKLHFPTDFVVVDYVVYLRTFLRTLDELSNLDDDYYDTEGDILYVEKLLNEDPSPNLPSMKNEDLNQVDATITKPSIEEPPELKLKELPSYLEYAFLEGTDKLPVIISKELKDEEKSALLKDDFKLAVQHQRRVNLKIHEVIEKEVIKLLDAGLIYPIFDSPWVSPVHCVPKKGGMIVIKNEDNELISTRLVTGWRVCIDYRKLNDATQKDHFSLPFMDQMLERLAGNEFYCFLDGIFRYFQILIDPQDQEKTTFTCLYGTFAYRRMPFGLCNAPGTFQRYMMAIFHDMMEVTMEEKCYFTVKEGIVLDHKISKSGIEVDRAKVDVIAKLPHPTFVKGVRSFLGVKNLVADHLSRLENPHQDELKKKEITETFPFETFGMIAFHEAKALPTNDARVVVKFLKSLFARFGTPCAIIKNGYSRKRQSIRSQKVKVNLGNVKVNPDKAEAEK